MMALCNNRLELYGYLEDQTDWFREPEFSGLLVILKIFPNANTPVLTAREVDRILDQKLIHQRLKILCKILLAKSADSQFSPVDHQFMTALEKTNLVEVAKFLRLCLGESAHRLEDPCSKPGCPVHINRLCAAKLRPTGQRKSATEPIRTQNQRPPRHRSVGSSSGSKSPDSAHS